MSAKFYLLSSAMMLTAISASATADSFVGFTTRISPREARQAVTARVLPANPVERISRPVIPSDPRFVGWNDADPSSPVLAPREATEEEMLDEVTGTYLDGKPMSRQTFEYTTNGKPLKCTNYVPSPDGKSYVYNGHYAYEYDDQGRVISAEKVSVDSSSVRYEYAYSGNDPIFNQQIAYHADEQGDWIPFQKGEYEYDINYNTIKETYSMWVEEGINDWVPVYMNDATYDELSRLTSYFPYMWDAKGAAWVGNNEGTYEGQRFEYTQAGDDALQADYTWEDGKWLEYHHLVYTYNDSDLLTMLEKLYWNRDKQDWSGGDAYGEWGDIKTNGKEEYEYDEYGRNILCNVFKFKSGKYVNNYRETKAYEELPDGATEVTEVAGSVSNAGQDFAPYAKSTSRFNRFGSEMYYISYKTDSNDVWQPQQEEIRYFMDGYNWFIGGDYYFYVDGERKNSSKERFYYADDFNPELEYETPYEGRHWVSGGKPEDDGWKLKSIDQFTWGPREVMTAYTGYNVLSGTEAREEGFEVEYDFTADCSKIFFWPDSNLGDTFYENKTLKTIQYLNEKAAMGVDSWNDAISYEFIYHYSPRNASVMTTGAADAVETARFDLTGRRINGPAKGINIVVYSDGSSRKVNVK